MMGRNQKWRQGRPFREGKQWEQVHGAGMWSCGEKADPQHGSQEFAEEEVGGEVEQVGRLGQCEDTMPGGCDCILDNGDSWKVFEKGNGMMKRSSENINLLMGCSVLELREVRGRKTSPASRPWQLE